MKDQDTIAALKELAVAYREAMGLDGAFDAVLIKAESVIAKHEDLKQTPPASIESDAPSEYMRGYSDGLAQAEETIAAAVLRARTMERQAALRLVIDYASEPLK